MKFAHKMICLLVLVLSASFGLGGCWLLYSDFAVQRRTVLTADAALHSQICTDVQTDLLDRPRRGLEMGGAVAAVVSGYMKSELVTSHAERRAKIESGEIKVVGLNSYTETEPSPLTADLDGHNDLIVSGQFSIKHRPFGI